MLCNKIRKTDGEGFELETRQCKVLGKTSKYPFDL